MRERLEQAGVDPVSGLLSIADHPECSLELKAKVLSDLISYYYPKLNNVQLTTPALSDSSLDELRTMLTKSSRPAPLTPISPQSSGLQNDLNDEPLNGRYTMSNSLRCSRARSFAGSHTPANTISSSNSIRIRVHSPATSIRGIFHFSAADRLTPTAVL